jgi:aspartate kinase
MICQSAPGAATIDFSFTMRRLILNPPCDISGTARRGSAPLITADTAMINLFGEEMVTSCGVAALALRTLRDAGIEVVLITTSDLDILCLYAGK